MEIITSDSRGAFQNEWLNSRHSFSFGEYYNPERMGFSNLRVINEDRVAANGGFPTHGHQDMEIITYVLEGSLSHQDSLGNGSAIRPGDVQRMSAGRGIRHSEFNHSNTEPVHLLQIWILPKIRGIRPGYAQEHFPAAERRGQLKLVASPDGREGSLGMNADANLYASLLEPGDSIAYTNPPQRAVYVHVARGELQLQGETLRAGDAAAIRDSGVLALTANQPVEFLLFDLPA